MNEETQTEIKSGNHVIPITQLSDHNSGKPKAVIIITTALGIRQEFYLKFATYLAENGFICILFDYFGIGKSSKGPLRKNTSNLVSWAEEDIYAVINWTHTTFPDLDTFYFSHSVGGQLFGLVENNTQIRAMVSVASQNGYWRYYKKKHRYALVFYTLFPFFTRLFRYFPGKRLGFGENLPKNAALQWFKWLKSENYLFDDDIDSLKNFEQFSGPLLTYSFSDDPFATEPAVDDLVQRYTNAIVTHRHLEPESLGLAKIGHVGFFKEKCKDTLWEEVVDWFSSCIQNQ